MAKIKHQGMGNATVVLLSREDRENLNSALIAFASENSLSMSALAKQIGVNRTYLYSLLDANQMELSRLIKIQNLINFQIVSESDAHLYLGNLWQSITNRSLKSDWINLCDCVFLDAFYVKRFLLPAMVEEIGTLSRFYSGAEALEPESILPSFSDEVYLVSLAETYLNNAIDSLGGEYGYIDTQFYETQDENSNREQLQLCFPILLNSNLWLDIFEAAHELIFDYYKPSDQTDGATVNSYREKHKTGSDNMDDSQAERFDSDIDYLRVMESHLYAERCIAERAAKIDEWANAIREYCTKEKRILRRQFYFPLELKMVAEEPLPYSIPVIESKKDAVS